MNTWLKLFVKCVLERNQTVVQNKFQKGDNFIFGDVVSVPGKLVVLLVKCEMLVVYLLLFTVLLLYFFTIYCVKNGWRTKVMKHNKLL